MIRKYTIAAAGLAAAALALSGITAASASTHPKANATLVCGHRCLDVSNLQLDGTGLGALIMNHANTSATSINLRAEGIAKTNEDFQAALYTTVGVPAPPATDTACGSGQFPPTSIFCLNPLLQKDVVFEADFAPDGNQTGLCAGAPVANAAGRLALMTCGISTNTVWVLDTANASVTVHGITYAGALNGADTSFSHPLALTVNPGSKKPLDVLRTDPENLTAGFLPDTQLFTVQAGPAGA